MKKVELEEWEEICPLCKGKGFGGCKCCEYDERTNANACVLCNGSNPCKMCRGSGKVDWLEKIHGGKRRNPFIQILLDSAKESLKNGKNK